MKQAKKLWTKLSNYKWEVHKVLSWQGSKQTLKMSWKNETSSILVISEKESKSLEKKIEEVQGAEPTKENLELEAALSLELDD